MNRFERAIDRLNRRGWTKGSYENLNGFCLTGAMGRHYLRPSQIVESQSYWQDEELVAKILQEQYPDINWDTIHVKWDTIPRWNDDIAQSKKEVIRVLEKASIAYEENKGL